MDVLPGVLASSEGYLLDLYPAHRAYSMRQLRRDYSGYAIKLRRDDNETADVNFDVNGLVSDDSIIANPSGGVSVTDLNTWVGSGDAFCTTWYDQSGEGVNALQSTELQQPKLYSSGTIITEGSPSRPALLFDGSNDHLSIDDAGLSFGSTFAFAVFNNQSSSGTRVVWSLSSGTSGWFIHIHIGGSDALYYDPGYPYPSNFYPQVTGQHLWGYKGAVGSQILYKNGTASPEGDLTPTDAFTDTSPTLSNGIGGVPGVGGGFYWQGEFQEFIAFDSDQSSNRTTIEADINSHFEIY